MSEKDVVKYFFEIKKAFETLYKLKIIHRNITPESIFLHDNSAYLSEFIFSEMSNGNMEEL